MAVTQLKDGRWICYYRAKGEGGKGRQIREYFGRGPAGEVAARARDNELGLKKPRPRKLANDTDFSECAAAYLHHKRFNPTPRKMLESRLQANILPFFGTMPALLIRDHDLDRYIRKRRTVKRTIKERTVIGVKYSTIRRELADIKAILNWSARRKPPLIEHNPIRDYELPRTDDAVILPPSPAETEAILNAAGPHLARAVQLSYYLGLRPGAVELLTLKWKNVAWDQRIIRVMSAHKGGPAYRDVPIHDAFMEILRQWYEEDGKKGPIIHYRGRPIKTIQHAWEGALQRAGITRRIRPYDLRHNYVTMALEKGADIKALSEIVGSSPETLRRAYQHVTSELRRETVAKIPALRPPEKK